MQSDIFIHSGIYFLLGQMGREFDCCPVANYDMDNRPIFFLYIFQYRFSLLGGRSPFRAGYLALFPVYRRALSCCHFCFNLPYLLLHIRKSCSIAIISSVFQKPYLYIFELFAISGMNDHFQ